MSLDFRKIEFGMSDAQSEGKRFPKLLTKGYFNSSEIVEKALDGGVFFFTGYKGSGKSALSEHLRLTNKNKEEIIITDVMMKSFPYKLFSKVVKGEAEHEAKYPLAWRWILCLYAINSFVKDTTLNLRNPDEWANAINVLRKKQIMPINSISEIVTKTSKNTFKLDLKIVEYSHESEPKPIDAELVGYFKSLLSLVRSSKRHYLIIDGLDDFLSEREQQNKSVMALINEAKDLNDWFIEKGIPFKIIVLCRTDLFDKLSDPNKNKIRQDYSFFIRWFDEGEADDYGKSNLIELANLRGKLTYENVEDIFDTFFPEKFDGHPIRNALLEYTRHTPRDFLQLLKYIQKSCYGEKVNEKAIAAGINKYSLYYFQSEIRDEMSGYIKQEDIESVFQLLSQLRQRSFKLRDIQKLAEENEIGKNTDFQKVFAVLFECSAVGHLKGADNKHYIKYRNPLMTFSPTDTIILHKGLWKALVV